MLAPMISAKYRVAPKIQVVTLNFVIPHKASVSLALIRNSERTPKQARLAQKRNTVQQNQYALLLAVPEWLEVGTETALEVAVEAAMVVAVAHYFPYSISEKETKLIALPGKNVTFTLQENVLM
jgi:hypothetical protein